MARATGGTITTSGSYTIHTFTSSGTFTPDATLDIVDVLVVGGGGGGGQSLAGNYNAGGGGGGGVRDISNHSVTPSVGITVTVGATSSAGANGNDSSFGSIVATGGGRGGGQAGGAGDGGSGGGRTDPSPPGNATVGTGNTPSTTPQQGYNGGSGTGTTLAGGGGGASQAGNTSGQGYGGQGYSSSISGSAVIYGSGGGGGRNGSGVLPGGTNAGSGGTIDVGATNGTANTGGGGGGGGNYQFTSQSATTGGSGIVIVRYLTDLPPVVTTTSPATSITSNSAQVSGNVTSQGSASVTERGIVYGTSTNPTIAGSKVTSGSGTGAFGPVSLTGLNSDTHYYARAYATSTVQTSYGANVEFDTLDAVISGTCTLAGSPVLGAIVTLIDSATDTVVATDTSDVSGNYAFNGLDITKTYHVVAEYEDSPDQYNAKSLPFMSPEEI